MPTRDLHSAISPTPAVNPTPVLADGVIDGPVIDLLGFESCEFLVQTGTVVSADVAVTVQHGDLADGSDMADAASSDLIGAAPAFGAADDNVVKRVGYRGAKRYVRLRLTASNVVSGITDAIAALCVRAHAHQQPTA